MSKQRQDPRGERDGRDVFETALEYAPAIGAAAGALLGSKKLSRAYRGAGGKRLSLGFSTRAGRGLAGAVAGGSGGALVEIAASRRKKKK